MIDLCKKQLLKLISKFYSQPELYGLQENHINTGWKIQYFFTGLEERMQLAVNTNQLAYDKDI